MKGSVDKKSSARATRAPARSRRSAARPGHDVILDVVFEEGLLFLAVRNISDEPAANVSMTFSRRIIGAGGTEVSATALFRNIAFLAPRKEIRTFLDDSASYFRRKGPTRFTATIRYEDLSGRPAVCVVTHDLEIYRDIRYAQRWEDAAREERGRSEGTP